MTGHSLVLPNTARSRTIADRANAPVCFRTVRRALSVEVVLLHHTLKSFSLGPADYIDIVARLKLCNAQVDFAFWEIIAQAKLAHEFSRFHARLFEFAEQRLGDAGFLLHGEANLHSRIAVVFLGQTPQQN